MMVEKVYYYCDECGKDVSETPGGKMFGPLCMTLEAPHYSTDITESHFCCVDHMLDWIRKNVVGSRVLAEWEQA